MVVHTLTPALRRQRQRQAELCEFEASLVYGVSSRTARTTQRNPVSKNQKEKKSIFHLEGDWVIKTSGHESETVFQRKYVQQR